MGLIILISQACNAVDGNVSTWTRCIQESWFYNSPELMGISLYLVAAYILYKAKLTQLPIILGTNLILAYTLAILTDVVLFQLLFVLSVILIMGAIAIAIINRFWK